MGLYHTPAVQVEDIRGLHRLAVGLDDIPYHIGISRYEHPYGVSKGGFIWELQRNLPLSCYESGESKELYVNTHIRFGRPF